MPRDRGCLPSRSIHVHRVVGTFPQQLAAMRFDMPNEVTPLQGGVILKRSRITERDRKSTRLNSSHSQISYAVFCFKKKITAFGVMSSPAAVRFDCDQNICRLTHALPDLR